MGTKYRFAILERDNTSYMMPGGDLGKQWFGMKSLSQCRKQPHQRLGDCGRKKKKKGKKKKKKKRDNCRPQYTTVIRGSGSGLRGAHIKHQPLQNHDR